MTSPSLNYRVLLISTADPERPGSMRRYGELVERALEGDSPDGVRPLVAHASIAPASGPCRAGRLANGLHHGACAWRVLQAVREAGADIVHILDGSHAYLATLLPRRQRVVASVHDLIPVLTAGGELPGPRPSPAGRLLWGLSLRGLRRCAHVLANSAWTAGDLRRIAGLRQDRVTVAHLPAPGSGPDHTGGKGVLWSGVAAAGGLPCRAEIALRRSGGTAPAEAALHAAGSAAMILHVGHNAAYKNREGVLRVASLVLREHAVRLVLVGPPPTPALRVLASELGLGHAAEWRCDVGDAELQTLYREAAIFLFPSLYEGFGWPPLEAMSAGTPVVCSNAASLPEVVGDAALTAGPGDHERLARHCLDLLTQPALRAALVRRGHENVKRFTLERFAEQLLAAYAAALRTTLPTLPRRHA